MQTTFEGFEYNTQDKVRSTQLKYDLKIPFGHAAAAQDGGHLPQTMTDYRTGGTPWFTIVEPGGRVIYDNFRLDADRFLAWGNQLPPA